MESHIEVIAETPRKKAWNKGKLVGQKPPLRSKHVWSISTKCDSALNWDPLPTVAHPSDFTRKTQIWRGPGRRR
jgi:hypothetical protein